MLLSAQSGHFSHTWEDQPSSSLNNDNNLSSLSSCPFTGPLGFRGCLGFWGRSLALTPYACSLFHSPTHLSTTLLCHFIISFHSSCSAAFAAFQSPCAKGPCSISSASSSFLPFWSLTGQMSFIAFGKQNGTVALLVSS